MGLYHGGEHVFAMIESFLAIQKKKSAVLLDKISSYFNFKKKRVIMLYGILLLVLWRSIRCAYFLYNLEIVSTCVE
jgi:hypothetical protein